MRVMDGRGPGSDGFRNPGQVLVGALDSILVFDRGAQALFGFSREGGLARRTSLSGDRLRAGALVRFSDGRWAAREEEGGVPGTPGTMPRDSVRFWGLGAGLRWDRDIVEVPGQYTSSVAFQGRVGYRSTPFTPRVSHGSLDRCLYVNSGDTPEVYVYSTTGGLVQTIRVPGRRRAVTPADWAAWVDAMAEPVPPERRQEHRDLANMLPRPPFLPVYHDLVVDALGYIWLQHFEVPFGPGPAWTVLEPDGDVLGEITLPEPLEVFEISGSVLLGKRRQGLFRETLVVYAIERGSAGPPPPHAACAGESSGIGRAAGEGR